MKPSSWKKKVEIIANALYRDKQDKKTALSQVFDEYIAKDKNKAKSVFDECHRAAIIRDKISGTDTYRCEQEIITRPGTIFFKSWFYKDGPSVDIPSTPTDIYV